MFRCGAAEHFYCKEWGCETTAYWKPTSNWDAVITDRAHPYETEETVIKNEWWQRCLGQGTQGTWSGQGVCLNFTCNRLNITFTDKGKKTENGQKGNNGASKYTSPDMIPVS